MEGKEDARIVYGDIIGHPHHRSESRAPMSLCDRAAQFLSYDALAGYFDMIAEEERVTDPEKEPEGEDLERLNRKLALLEELTACGERPLVRFTIFVPDGRKEGGCYLQITDRVRGIEPTEGRIILQSRRERSGSYQSIEIRRVRDLRGEGLEEAED